MTMMAFIEMLETNETREWEQVKLQVKSSIWDWLTTKCQETTQKRQYLSSWRQVSEAQEGGLGLGM